MDVSSLTLNAKNPKLSEENGVDEESKNGIGHLDDSLLQRIVSFLPTKDAVRTCILSKRWACLWMSVPNLDFEEGAPADVDLYDEEVLNKRACFLDFVERVLLLRDSSPITNFSLSCNVFGEWARINAWIATVVKRNVQVLDISFKKASDSFVLPCCLFTCDSLQVFNLYMIYRLELPNFVHFSNLKTLNITRVTFTNDYTVKLLFDACPVLEELGLIVCSWDGVRGVCINSPRLKRLSIIEKHSTSPLESDDENFSEDARVVDDTCTMEDACQFAIFSANLENFSYKGSFVDDYCFYSSSSVVNASILMEYGRTRAAYRAFKLLMGLFNAKSLTMCERVVEVLTTYAQELFDNLPEFHDLNHFQIDLTLLLFKHDVLLAILQKLPCLSSLKLEGTLSPTTCYGKNDWTLDPLPACFCTHLKTIQISWFCGYEHELYGVKVLLQSARVLERLVISFNPWELDGDLKKQDEIRQQVISFPRASENCVIATSCPLKRKLKVTFG
ncbi:F-box/FBD/LRR-repeat protein At5g56420-like [Malania oleifera]|uniref:F-box/FBD/LRR-repeat protein At5g56420-like n=1 Tax=Malania oleifera TaxID=397392 RepID=UPI0025AE04A8|nr:F-box/FBD/LRR-repeat protein At5g56420-like [Malania oleifera]XP_057979430.1 F-box/FBD/LRR-repeat protein At5g56420-like [Malania oleifera]XP_057979431.1 F-box/FBD/LRR-repeat protein At5g56420-like [Malania oleifera]